MRPWRAVKLEDRSRTVVSSSSEEEEEGVSMQEVQSFSFARYSVLEIDCTTA